MTAFFTKNSYTAGPRGFVALMSTIIISAILMVLMVTTATSGFYARADSMGSDNKRVSLGLSDSCISAALLRVAQNYNYSLSSDPDYQTIPYNTAKSGVRVPVGTNDCYITGVTYGAEDPITHRKTVTIAAQAQYNGSFSNLSTKASIQNPSASTILPPPTCTLQASPASVPAGKPITVQWSASNNATSFTLTPTPSPTISNPGEAQSGTRTYTAAGSGAVTYTGIALNSSGTPSAACTASVTVTPAPPAPSCADTVMMFDRSGSMNTTDRANELAAATSTINLYASVASQPKVGAGSFGGYPNGGSNYASIPTSPNGQLQNTYSTLISTVTTFLGSNSSVGSHLSNAISAAVAELTSARATASKKVLIFVSDGEPTDTTTAVLNAADAAKLAGIQIFTVRYSQDTSVAGRTLMAQIASGNVANPGHQPGAQDDSSSAALSTGFVTPTATHSPNSWSSSDKGRVGDGMFATSSNSTNQQGYGTFAFTVPSGATVTGIEATLSGLVTGGSIQNTTITPNAAGNYNSSSWSTNTGSTQTNNKVAAVSDGSTFTYVTTATQNAAQTFKVDASGIPAGAVINSVKFTASVAKTSSGSPTFALRIEKGTNGGSQYDYTPAGSLATTYANFSTTTARDPFTNAQWTLAELTNWGFGVIKTSSSGTLHVSDITVTVNYTQVPSCTLGVDFSWNGGTNWTPQKSVTLSATAATTTLGTASDTWGHTWSAPNDFSSTNFVMRVSNTSCSGGLVAGVDALSAKVDYTAYDTTAENNDGDNFFITPLTATDMSNIFTTIGQKVCPAAAPACSNTIDDDGNGLIDAADPACHTDHNASNAASYDPTINSEWTPPSIPAPPPPPPPPPDINIGSWQEDPVLVTP